MKITEFITRVYRGDRDFARIDLRGATIPSLPLKNCDFTHADFRGAVFSGTRVSGCDFSHTDLRDCQFRSLADVNNSRFVRTNLSGAVLNNGQFSRCDFSGSWFNYAHLDNVWFRQVNLTGASFYEARWRDVVCAETTMTRCNVAGAGFHDSDISELTMAAEVLLFAERGVAVDFRTICRSLRSPKLEAFLLANDIPGLVVTYLIDCAHALDPKMLMSMLQSTFISYGSPDEAFAQRLRDELHRNGVKTFFFRTDAIPGERLHDVMHDGVNSHDRVILICSRASLTRPGVRNEIQETLDREARDGGANYLIPVAIDGFLFTWEDPLANRIRNRVVADFRDASLEFALPGYEDGRNVRVPSKSAFQLALQSLIRALKRKDRAPQLRR